MAWKHGWHFDNSIPDDPSDASTHHSEKYGIPSATFDKLTMRPVLMAAKKILDKDGRPIVVLVIESDTRDAFTEGDLKLSMEAAAEDLAPLLINFKMYLPSPDIAEANEL